jgi:tetratricopeptide (TPR) repeat protein
MLSDRFGLPISTSSQTARDAYIEGSDCVLSAEYGAEAHLQRAVGADPDFALAHAALARAYFLVGDMARARQAAARSRELETALGERERSHINALCLPIEGKGGQALAATRAHLAQHPRDAMVAAPATGVFGLIGFSGRQDREPEQIEFLDELRPHLANDWWFQMVYAFALEEIGRLDEALELIERSLAVRPGSAHGAHVKAHVLYEQGEDRLALDYLSGWLPKYPRQGLMHCHISWHMALSHLKLGDAKSAWDIYRSQVHPGAAWGPALNVATDAPSFLWRAELAGQAQQAELWREVHAYVQKVFPKPGIFFVDVHRSLTAIATGDDDGVAALVAELERRANAGQSPTGDAVPRIASGLHAYARGDWAAAIATLEPVLGECVRIGGSRAQRDLVRDTLLATYLKAGRTTEAHQLVGGVANRRPSPAVAGLV